MKWSKLEDAPTKILSHLKKTYLNACHALLYNWRLRVAKEASFVCELTTDKPPDMYHKTKNKTFADKLSYREFRFH